MDKMWRVEDDLEEGVIGERQRGKVALDVGGDFAMLDAVTTAFDEFFGSDVAKQNARIGFVEIEHAPAAAHVKDRLVGVNVCLYHSATAFSINRL